MLKAVNIRENAKRGTFTITSRPAGFSILFFLAGLVGLGLLPTSEYRGDYLAYGGLLFIVGLSVYYFVMSSQVVVFQAEVQVRVRHGFAVWTIPFDAISGGFTTYQEKVSRQSLAKTHFLDLELRVNLPDHRAHRIRNGTANVFHYGFSYWGPEQESIRAKLHHLLKAQNIPLVARK